VQHLPMELDAPNLGPHRSLQAGFSRQRARVSARMWTFKYVIHLILPCWTNLIGRCRSAARYAHGHLGHTPDVQRLKSDLRKNIRPDSLLKMWSSFANNKSREQDQSLNARVGPHSFGPPMHSKCSQSMPMAFTHFQLPTQNLFWVTLYAVAKICTPT
jgi:hypothetical protein